MGPAPMGLVDSAPQPMAEGAEMKDVPVMKQMEDCARHSQSSFERADRGQARLSGKGHSDVGPSPDSGHGRQALLPGAGPPAGTRTEPQVTAHRSGPSRARASSVPGPAPLGPWVSPGCQACRSPASWPPSRPRLSPSLSRGCSLLTGVSVSAAHWVHATPDPAAAPGALEETHSARGAGLVTPWTLRSCGKGACG